MCPREAKRHCRRPWRRVPVSPLSAAKLPPQTARSAATAAPVASAPVRLAGAALRLVVAAGLIAGAAGCGTAPPGDAAVGAASADLAALVGEVLPGLQRLFNGLPFDDLQDAENYLALLEQVPA